MKVRLAEIQDAKTLLGFIALKAEFDRSMKGFQGEITTNIDKIERTLFGQSPFAHALLLESESKAIGFALYHFRYSSFSGEASIWLDDLLVLGKERSRGCGATLMRALMAQAQQVSAAHISWTASPQNLRVHEFYKTIGANIERMDGERPYFRWETQSS